MAVPGRLLHIEVIVVPNLSSWWFIACGCSSEVVAIYNGGSTVLVYTCISRNPYFHAQNINFTQNKSFHNLNKSLGQH